MNTAVLIFVLATDLLLGYFIYNLYKRKEDHTEELEALFDETKELKAIKQQFDQEINDSRIQVKEAQKKVQHLASEIEREIANSKETIAKELTDVLSSLAEKINAPLLEFEKKQGNLQLLLRKIEGERSQLRTMVARAEQLTKFFDQKVPYDQVLKDIEYKKYQDARKMFAQGYSREHIGRELGLNAAEMNIVQQLSLSNSAF